MKRQLAFLGPVLIVVLALSTLLAAPVFGEYWEASTMVNIQGPIEPVPVGTSVTLIVTETNDGAPGFWLAEPWVSLEPGGYILNKATGYYFGGDVNNDGELDVGETWEWRVNVTVSADTLFIVIGHGYAKGGKNWDVTYGRLNDQGNIAWPNERAEVMVNVVHQPSVSLTKSVDSDSILPGEPVTYTYTVTNTGGVTLTEVTVTDDNGTPDYSADDFVVGTVSSLAPGQQATFEMTKIPPVTLCVNVDGAIKHNLLITEIVPDQNGDGIEDIKVTYRQSRDLVDNVYGVPATDPASGWPPRTHTFGNFTGSDKAIFRFTDASGVVVLEFKADYITASTKYLSGFGTLGVTGGDGGMIMGSAASVLSVSTTISTNLNQSPAFYGFTTNSPTPESSYPTWDYVDGYTVVVSGATFGASGFGNVTVPSVHNSPAKIGSNEALPTPCKSDVTNTATVTAVAGSITLTATASATVHLAGGAVVSAPFMTFKQDQWGGDPNKPGGAKLLGENFSTVYPSGVTVGGMYTLTFTSASAVHAFLPQGGEPKVLKSSAINPIETGKKGSGEFAGQVLALQLNVDFSNAGIIHSGLAALHLKSGKLVGKTVAEVLSLANNVLGSEEGLLPAGVSIKDLKDIVKKINENYENGTHDRGYLQ